MLPVKLTVDNMMIWARFIVGYLGGLQQHSTQLRRLIWRHIAQGLVDHLSGGWAVACSSLHRASLPLLRRALAPQPPRRILRASIRPRSSGSGLLPSALGPQHLREPVYMSDLLRVI